MLMPGSYPASWSITLWTAFTTCSPTMSGAALPWWAETLWNWAEGALTKHSPMEGLRCQPSLYSCDALWWRPDLQRWLSHKCWTSCLGWLYVFSRDTFPEDTVSWDCVKLGLPAQGEVIQVKWPEGEFWGQVSWIICCVTVPAWA